MQQGREKSLETAVLYLCFCTFKPYHRCFSGVKFRVILRFSKRCWSTQDDGHSSPPLTCLFMLTTSSTTALAVVRHQWGITMPNLASRDPDLSGQTAHRQFSRKAIIRLLTRKGINLQSKIPDKDLKALSSDTLSSSAGCAQDCLHLLVNLFCGKDHRRKQAFSERLC